mgnify:CR=1 FL=1
MTGHAGNFKLKTVSFTEGNIDKETFLEEFGNNKIESQLWSKAIRKALFFIDILFGKKCWLW